MIDVLPYDNEFSCKTKTIQGIKTPTSILSLTPASIWAIAGMFTAFVPIWSNFIMKNDHFFRGDFEAFMNFVWIQV